MTMIIPYWLLGCIISLSGSIGAVCGTAIQKISFRRNEALPLSSRRVYYKQTRWLAGLVLVFIGGLTDFVSLGMAPQSTIAALGSVSLAANVPLAYFWLGETIAWRDGAGTALIVIGSTVSVVFGDHSDTSYSTSQLKQLYTHTPYILYGSIIVTCMVIMYFTCRFKLTPLRVKLVESIDRYNTLQLECNMAIAAEQAEREEQAAYRRNLSGVDLAGAIPVGSTPKVASPPIITNIVVAPASAVETREPLLASDALASDEVTSEMKSPVTDSSAIRDTGAETIIPNGTKQPLLSGAVGSSSYNSLSSLVVPDDLPNSSSAVLTSLQYTAPLAEAREEMVALELEYTPYSNVHSVFYCAISGVFGAQSLLFGKSVAELIADSMKSDGENQFLDPLSYVFMAALGCCLLGQLHFFASGLQLFDALFVVPVFKCFFLTLSTIGGGLFFQEFECFDLMQAVLSPIGLLLNLIGVYVLSSRTMGVPPVRRASIVSDEEEDELFAGNEIITSSENETEPAIATVLDFGTAHEENAALKEELLLRRRSRASCDSVDLDEEEAHARAIAEASENLLRSAVEIAHEEAAAAAAQAIISPATSSRGRSEPGISDIATHVGCSGGSGASLYLQPPANEQVLLVTNMDGIVLVASPIVNHNTSMMASPEAASIFEQRQREASILHAPTPISRAPTMVLNNAATGNEEPLLHGSDAAARRTSSVTSPDMKRQGSSASVASMASVASEPIISHYGSTDFGSLVHHHPSSGNMSIVVADENAPTVANSRRSSATAVSHPEAPLYPSLMTPQSGRGSSLSTGGGGGYYTPAGATTHINMFSIPASLPQTGGILRSSTTAPTRDQFSAMLGSTPASYASGSSSNKFSNLKRAASEQSPLDQLDNVHPASLNNGGVRGSISTLRASATFSRPPRSGRGSVPPQPVVQQRGVARKPSDVLVQRGSIIYRTAGTAVGGSSTPLDAALSDSIGVAHANSSGAGGRTSTEPPGSALDSVPVFLTPGASSSFTVQSPLTHAEYSIPRRDSIFAHTRSYLRRLSQAALGVSGGGGAGVPGILAQPHHHNHRTSMVASPTNAETIKGHTAPSPRMSDSERALMASHTNEKPHAFSDGIGPTTYLEQQFAAAHTFNNNQHSNQQQVSSIAQNHADMGPSSLSQHWGLGGPSELIAPPQTPSNTYVPPQFLIQPLAQPQKQNDPAE